jgi:cobalt/nickel transport system permease protein
MHLPDHFLSPSIALGLDVVAAGAVAVAARRARRSLDEQDAPLLGLLGALVFAAQMVNLPVGGGTSGHLLGGVLVASVLGPAAGTLVMASVFLMQCLLFQDGGLLALGANFLNMGLVGTVGGYYLARFFTRCFPSRAARSACVFAASWISIVAASALVAVQLWLSGTAPLGPVLVAMLSWHALIGLLEGAITTSALSLLARARPALLAKHLGAEN